MRLFASQIVNTFTAFMLDALDCGAGRHCIQCEWNSMLVLTFWPQGPCVPRPTLNYVATNLNVDSLSRFPSRVWKNRCRTHYPTMPWISLALVMNWVYIQHYFSLLFQLVLTITLPQCHCVHVVLSSKLCGSWPANFIDICQTVAEIWWLLAFINYGVMQIWGYQNPGTDWHEIWRYYPHAKIQELLQWGRPHAWFVVCFLWPKILLAS